jgi:acetylornithine deacetylase/succinyl-diaminopimelate desuccinylase-like protein
MSTNQRIDLDRLMGRIFRLGEIGALPGGGAKRVPPGDEHDVQMFAPNCPTAMVFVPSKNRLSHNVNEHTAPEEIRASVDVLLQVARARAVVLENSGEAA